MAIGASATVKAIAIRRAKAIKAIIVNDTSNWYHYGCHLTSSGLRELAGSRFATVSTIEIQALTQARLSPPSPACLEPGNLARFVADNPDMFGKLDAHDVAIVNGEGSLHGAGAHVLKLFSLIQAASTMLGKTIYIVNHSAYPNDDDTLRGSAIEAVYRDTYALAGHVAVRDPISARLLNGLGIACVESFDCAVLKIEARSLERQRKIVFAGSATDVNAQPFFAAIDQLRRDGWTCAFLTGAPDRPAKDDQRLLAAAARQGIDAPVRAVADAQAFLDEIASAALLISGRFHYTIAAYALGTPFVVLRSNTPKNNALCRMLDRPAPLEWTAPDLTARLVAAAYNALNEPVGRRSDKLEQLRAMARLNLP